MTDHHPPSGTRGYTERVHAVIDRIPERTALSDLEHHLTFRELGSAIVATARAILAADAAHGPALVTTEGTLQAGVSMLAAAATGRACVMTGPKSSTAGLQDVARHTGATLVLGSDSSERRAAGLPIVTPTTTGAPSADLRILLDGALAERIQHGPVVAIGGTSGTTGNPKLIRLLTATVWGRELAPVDRLATDRHVATPLSASGAFRNRLAVAIISGSPFTAFPLDRYPPATLLHRLSQADITHLLVTPSVLRRLHLAARGRTALAGVREVATNGEPLHWSDVDRIRTLCGPDVTVINRYGSTEAGMVTQQTVEPGEPPGEGALSVGHPLPGRRVWIADENGKSAEVGKTGRIVIEGVFTTDGVPLEALPDGRARFRTADLGRIDADGALWFEGRADRMVKVAATRVEPGAIEDIIRDIPGVLDAAVLPVNLALGEKRLVAHVVLEDGTGVDARTLRRLTAERVVSVAVPVRFKLWKRSLPLLASGKIDRLTLAEMSHE